MLPKCLKYGVVLACGVLLLAGLPASADDKKGDKLAPAGAWGKKDGELTLAFADKGVLKIAPHGDRAGVAIVCTYTVAKGGLVKAKVTRLEAKEEVKKKLKEHVPVGFKFSFKWSVQGDAAKLEGVTGDNVETLKSHLEGDFEKK